MTHNHQRCSNSCQSATVALKSVSVAESRAIVTVAYKRNRDWSYHFHCRGISFPEMDHFFRTALSELYMWPKTTFKTCEKKPLNLEVELQGKRFTWALPPKNASRAHYLAHKLPPPQSYLVGAWFVLALVAAYVTGGIWNLPTIGLDCFAIVFVFMQGEFASNWNNKKDGSALLICARYVTTAVV